MTATQIEILSPLNSDKTLHDPVILPQEDVSSDVVLAKSTTPTAPTMIAATANLTTPTPLEIARALTAHGERVIPIPYKEKGPKISGWQKLILNDSDLPQYFSDAPMNIGRLNGEPSGWIVDVDLDHELAVKLGGEMLPTTPSIFGRQGKPASHRQYRVTAPVETKQWRLGKNGMILELRSTGSQTVMPGSTHPSGELIHWDSDGQPVEIEPEVLLAACEKLVAAVAKGLGVELKSKPTSPPMMAPASPVKEVPSTAASPGREVMCMAYLRKLPDAISGQGGHGATFHAACVCYQFGLTDAQAQYLMGWFNANKTGGNPWTQAELTHKLEDAKQKVEEEGKFGCMVSDVHRTSNAPSTRTLTTVDEPEGNAALPPEEAASTGKPYPCTDVGNAERLAARNGDKIRHANGVGFLVYHNGCWTRKNANSRVLKLAIKTVRRIYKEASRAAVQHPDISKTLSEWAHKSESRERLTAMVNLVQAMPGILVDVDDLDRDTMLFNCRNGTIDLRDGVLHPHDPADLITRISPVDFKPESVCPLWVKALERIFRTHTELIPYFQKVAGYCMTGSTKEHALFFLYGFGANGKTTLMDQLLHIMGDYAGKADRELLTAKRQADHPTGIADLQGRRLAVLSETEDGARLSEAKLKDLTGETRVKARYMGKDFFEFDATHKIVMSGNHKPQIRGTDEGIWRRIRVLPFVETITADEKDLDLGAKLKAEAEGVLAWMVQGVLAWQKDGLGTPPEVEKATGNYRSENDIMAQFISDCCEPDPKAQVSAKTLYKVYKEWADAANEFVLSQKLFGSKLKERGFDNGGRDSHSGGTVWRGIKIRPQDGSTEFLVSPGALTASGGNSKTVWPAQGPTPTVRLGVMNARLQAGQARTANGRQGREEKPNMEDHQLSASPATQWQR